MRLFIGFIAWVTLASLIVLMVVSSTDTPTNSRAASTSGYEHGVSSSRSSSNSLRAASLSASSSSAACTATSLGLSVGWPMPDASADAAARCKAEQEGLLAAAPEAFIDERAFIRTIDLLFSSEGVTRTGMSDCTRPVRLVTAGATFDSLWGRYPSLGRGYVAHDRLVFLEGNNLTVQQLRKRSWTRLAGRDPRVVVHAAAPWSSAMERVVVRSQGGPKEGRPVQVDLAGPLPAPGVMLPEGDGTVMPALTVDQALLGERKAGVDTWVGTAMEPDEGWGLGRDGVDVLLIGEAAGQELEVLAGAREVLKQTRLVLFACHPSKWSGQEWDTAVGTLESAGHTVVLLGHRRHLLLGKGLTPAGLDKAAGRGWCMGVHTAGGPGSASLSRDAGFVLELLLAGRRAVLRADTLDGQLTGLVKEGQEGGKDVMSPCVAVASARIMKGCGGAVFS